MSAQEILKLIETVAPDDHAKLDEIDARVFFYLHPVELRYYQSFERYLDGVRVAEKGGNFGLKRFHPRYTLSRDALKKIRPRGENWWSWTIRTSGGGPYHSCKFFRYSGFGERETPNLPTEELAELHAIIQAIEHEGKKT